MVGIESQKSEELNRRIRLAPETIGQNMDFIHREAAIRARSGRQEAADLWQEPPMAFGSKGKGKVKSGIPGVFTVETSQSPRPLPNGRLNRATKEIHPRDVSANPNSIVSRIETWPARGENDTRQITD
jgi:hypothetical protein